MRRTAPALLAIALAGCTAGTAAPGQCLLPSQHRMLVAELFFGRALPEGGIVSQADWADFAGRTIATNFPAGFTVFDGKGQWRDPRDGHVVGEPSKVVVIAVSPRPNLAARLRAVVAAYKARFGQQSVGVVTRDSCAGF